MAAPNLVNIQTCTPTTTALILTTGSQNVVSNSLASGKSYKINTILAANYTGSPATVTVNYYQNSDSIAHHLVYQLSVAANTVLIVVDKSHPIYLQEGDIIQALSGTATAIDLTVSYEVLS